MTKWYYRDYLNRKIGPLSADEFQDCVMEGEILPETRVWRSGLTAWTTYAGLLESEAVCASVTHGPATRIAPRSSSRRTGVVLGSSTLHQLPRSSVRASSSAAPHADRVLFEKSATYRRRYRKPRLRVRDPQTAMETRWLGKQFLRIAMVATALTLVHFAATEAIKSSAKAAIAAPAPENAAVGPTVQIHTFNAQSYAGLPPEFGNLADRQP
jgi:hypothetical protein